MVATFSGVVSGGAVVVVVFSAGGSVAAPTGRVNQLRCCLRFHPNVTWSENTSIIALTLVDLADVSEVGVAVEVVPESRVLVHVDAVLLISARATVIGLILINSLYIH